MGRFKPKPYKLKTNAVKWVRNIAKSRYNKSKTCYICGTSKNLEVHHLYCVSTLFYDWVHRNNLIVDTDEDAVVVRYQFLEEHEKEMYWDVYTLCSMHHKQLHGIFGQKPPVETIQAQIDWIEDCKRRGYSSRNMFTEFY